MIPTKPSPRPQAAPKRIVWLDILSNGRVLERDVAHVTTEPQLVQSYVVSAAEDAPAYAYAASHAIRRATVEELEAWRQE